MHFIKLSDVGIMTGDQSLFEYMSIKKELPYYDMQTWKKTIVANLLDQAKESNIYSLKEYYAAKFLGNLFRSSRESNCIDISVSLHITDNSLDSYKIQDKDIKRKTSEKIAIINQQKQNFEAILLAQDARCFIKEYLQNI